MYANAHSKKIMNVNYFSHIFELFLKNPFILQ
jgi:hypothetical protein